jgi:F-type H+-transporting ATPase subunit delta
MKDRKLANRYARALLAALPDPQKATAADLFLADLARAMDTSAGVRAALLDPGVPRSVRQRALGAVVEQAGAGPELKNFLATIVDNRRVGEIPAIAAAFHEALEVRSGILPAAVTTAQPLDAETQGKLRAALERLTGRRIRLTIGVDPTLVGGLVSRIGSTVYDGSIRTQLAGLRRRMAEE